MLGETVSHYRIVDKLGEGGMGVVYRAEDVRLGRSVALKVLSPRLAADAVARRRFADEARAASSLDHPNICSLYDVGEAPDGRLFLALALCEGETLSAELERGAIEPARALAIAAQIADGLAEAHAKGILHRDIKPANIMLRPDGLVKILDFGVAKLERDVGVTGPTDTVGSPAYMAPEQIRSGRVGPGADLWSLGVVLFEMITGRRPFEGGIHAVIDSILNDSPPALYELRPGVHSQISRIVARTLERDPADRYPSARDLAADLRAIAASRDDATLAISMPQRSPAATPAPARIRQNEGPVMDARVSVAQRLPLPPTAFVGRSAEVAQVRRLLLDERRRLVTLTGPGGVGKTRIAIEVARRIEPSFRGGAIFVGLAELEDAALVTRRIAEAAGVREGNGRSPDLEALLRHRELLLVLDSFEHLLPAADCLGRLLAACPHLTMLATSREVLHLRGEAEVTIEPMRLAPAGSRRAEAVAGCEAVALFVDRAREVKPDFAVTEENAAAIGAICNRLDGLPLAIELAASRLKLFSPDLLLRRLDEHQSSLVARARDLPERQRTLDATIGWSYELLTLDERSLLRQLAVFSGGFSLETAEEVIEVPGLDLEAGLLALSDKSLLHNLEDTLGEARFGLLNTIRDWVERRQDEPGAPPRDAVRARHAAWFLALAEAAEPDLASERRDPRIRRLRVEGDNLRVALRFAIDRGEADRTLRAMGGLAWAWYRLGQLSEGRSWLEQALALPDAGRDPVARSRALTGAARLARYQDDFTAGRAWADQAVRLARLECGDRDLAFALNALGLNAQPLGDPIAVSAAIESVALMRRAGDPWGLALCVFYLGTFAFFLGDQRLVRPSLEESAELFRGLGDRWGLAGALFYLGWLEEREGRRRRARELLEESVDLLRIEDDKWRAAFALRRLAEVEDDAARAEVLRAEAHALEETLGIGEAFTPAPTPRPE